MSILQPSCKHNHHEKKIAKIKPVVAKSATQIANKL